MEDSNKILRPEIIIIDKICDANSSDPVLAISKVVRFICLRLNTPIETLFDSKISFSSDNRIRSSVQTGGILNRACELIDARKLAQELWKAEWVVSGRDLSTGQGPCCQGSSRHAFGVFEHGFNCLRCGTGGGIVKMVSLMLSIDNKQSRKFVVEYAGLSQSSPDDVRKIEIQRGAQISASKERELLMGQLRRFLVRVLLPRMRWLRAIARFDWTSDRAQAVREGVSIARVIDEVEDALAELKRMTSADCVSRKSGFELASQRLSDQAGAIDRQIGGERAKILALRGRLLDGDAHAARAVGAACAEITRLEMLKNEEVRKAKNIQGRSDPT